MSASDAAAAGEGDGAPLQTSRILVVDDSRGIRELFRIMLHAALPDREISVAENGKVAVERFERERPGVLLMDLNMPVMDGETAFIEIDRLCRAKGWRVPAVVFCTGYAPPDLIRSLTDGETPHYLLTKPVSEDELVGAIRRCLGV
jgi:CheY-like chemotaxis protein